MSAEKVAVRGHHAGMVAGQTKDDEGWVMSLSAPEPGGAAPRRAKLLSCRTFHAVGASSGLSRGFAGMWSTISEKQACQPDTCAAVEPYIRQHKTQGRNSNHIPHTVSHRSGTIPKSSIERTSNIAGAELDRPKISIDRDDPAFHAPTHSCGGTQQHALPLRGLLADQEQHNEK